jgi:hypothetical protein
MKNSRRSTCSHCSNASRNVGNRQGLVGSTVQYGRRFYCGRSGSNTLQIGTLEQKLIDDGAITIMYARLILATRINSAAIVSEALKRLGAKDTLDLAGPVVSFQDRLLPRLDIILWSRALKHPPTNVVERISSILMDGVIAVGATQERTVTRCNMHACSSIGCDMGRRQILQDPGLTTIILI